jgi:hypothetical protein
MALCQNKALWTDNDRTCQVKVTARGEITANTTAVSPPRVGFSSNLNRGGDYSTQHRIGRDSDMIRFLSATAVVEAVDYYTNTFISGNHNSDQRPALLGRRGGETASRGPQYCFSTTSHAATPKRAGSWQRMLLSRGLSLEERNLCSEEIDKFSGLAFRRTFLRPYLHGQSQLDHTPH